MHFRIKNTLKNNHNHYFKHAQNQLVCLKNFCKNLNLFYFIILNYFNILI